jgi:hypothetical protein
MSMLEVAVATIAFLILLALAAVTLGASLDKLLTTLLRSGLLAVLLLLALTLLVSWLVSKNAWKHAFFLNKKLR